MQKTIESDGEKWFISSYVLYLNIPNATLSPSPWRGSSGLRVDVVPPACVTCSRCRNRLLPLLGFVSIVTRSDPNTNVAKPEWTDAGHLTLGGLFAPVRQPKYLPVIVDDTPGFIALNGFDGEAGLCGGRGDGIAKLRGENWAIYLGHCRLNSVSYNTTALICKRSKMEE